MTSHYLLSFIHQYHVTVRSHSVSFWRNVDRTAAGNIDTMPLEMKICPWIHDTQYEWMNNKQSLCLRCLHWCVYPEFQWYDVMTK